MIEHRSWYTPIFEDAIDPLTNFQRDEIVSFINYLTSSVASRKLSNVGGWQSPSYFRGDHYQLDCILDKIQAKLDLISHLADSKLVVDNYWININHRGDSNSRHNHPLSIFSGVVYLDASLDQGNIRFSYPGYDMINFSLPSMGMNKLCKLYYDFVVQPLTDKIVIFPSYVSHTVEQNPTDRPRISLAFNTKYLCQ